MAVVEQLQEVKLFNRWSFEDVQGSSPLPAHALLLFQKENKKNHNYEKRAEEEKASKQIEKSETVSKKRNYEEFSFLRSNDSNKSSTRTVSNKTSQEEFSFLRSDDSNKRAKSIAPIKTNFGSNPHNKQGAQVKKMGADAYTARRQGDIRASFKREPLQELSTAQQLKIMAQTKCNTPAVPKGRDDIHRPAKVSAQLLVKPVVLEQPPSRVFKQPSVDHVRADASIGRRQDEIKTGFTRKPSVQPKAASRLNAMTQTKCHAPGLPKEHDIHRPARPLVQSAVAQLQNIKTQRSVNPPRVPKGLDDRPRTLALHTVDSQSSGHGTRMPSVQPTAAQRLDAMTQIKCDAPEVPKGHDIHSPVRPLVQSATAQQQNIKTQKSVNPPRVTKGLDDRPRTLTMHTVDPQPYGHGTSKPSVQPTAAQPLLDTITQIRSDDPEVPKGHDIHRLSRPSMQSVVAQQRNIKTRNWNPPPLPKGVNDRPSTMAMQRVDPQPFGHRMERGTSQNSFVKAEQEVDPQ